MRRVKAVLVGICLIASIFIVAPSASANSCDILTNPCGYGRCVITDEGKLECYW